MGIIQFVGDPFVDTGVAVLEHRTGKGCSDITLADLAEQADKIETTYSQKAWAGHLRAYFPNSCWCNPNAKISIEKKCALRATLLRSFDLPPIDGKFCAYCRRPAQHRADRSRVPLLTGAKTMTSGPGGEPGMLICSGCQYAIQFYPLAAKKVNGRGLSWWTADEKWMFALTADFANDIAKIVDAGPEEIPNLSWPATRLLDTIIRVTESLPKFPEGPQAVDIVGCHATNFATGPRYDEWKISKSIVEFLRTGLGYQAFNKICSDGWSTNPDRKKKNAKSEDDQQPKNLRRNSFYEDIGAYLAGKAGLELAIIRRHFLPQARKHCTGVFELAIVFARKVIGMTNSQVTAIRKLADQIANSDKAKKHLRRLFKSRWLSEYMAALTEISYGMKGDDPPLEFDTVLTAFNLASETDVPGAGAAVVRELILLRLIEKLPADELPEPEADHESEDESDQEI